MECDVPGCFNKSTFKTAKQIIVESRIGKITYYNFPFNEPEICQKWKDFVNKASWTPSHKTNICSQHFEEKYFKHSTKGKRLLPDAIPTITVEQLASDTAKISYCSVEGCINQNSRDKYRLVRFPLQSKDPREFSRWVENIMNFPQATDAHIQNITAASRICVDHFEQECFKIIDKKQILKYGSVPTLKLTGKPIHKNCFKQETPKRPQLEMPKCAVTYCSSKFLSETNVSFHPFPIDWTLNIQWIQATKKHNRNNKFEYLCSKHFREDCFEPGLTRVLKKGSVPSIFTDIGKNDKNTQNIEEIILQNTSRTPLLHILDNTEDPLASSSMMDTKFDSNLSILNEVKQNTLSKINPLKRTASTDLEESSTKVVVLSKPQTISPKRIVIVKKSNGTANNIALLSPDKKITFVPKNTIKIATPSSIHRNLAQENFDNVLKNVGKMEKKLLVGCEIKSELGLEKTSNHSKNIEQVLVINNEKNENSSINNAEKNTLKSEEQMKKNLGSNENISSEDISSKNKTNKPNILKKHIDDKSIDNNDINDQNNMESISKNSVEGSKKSSQKKLKPKYYFLQCNDVKNKRKTMPGLTFFKDSKDESKPPENIPSDVEKLSKKPSKKDKTFKNEINIDTDKILQDFSLDMIPKEILEQIKKDKGKILKILPVRKVTSNEIQKLQNTDQTDTKSKTLPKLREEPIYNPKHKNLPRNFFRRSRTTPYLEHAKNCVPVILSPEKPLNDSKNIFESPQKVFEVPQKDILETPMPPTQKDNFVSCDVVDLTDCSNELAIDEQIIDTLVAPKDPLSLSDDELVSDDANSLLVPIETVQKIRNRKVPRKVLIKYVAQNQNSQTRVETVAKKPYKITTRRREQKKNNIDPFLTRRKTFRENFDFKISMMVPKVVLKDIFYGKNPLPNTNIRITVHTRSFPKNAQKEKNLPQNTNDLVEPIVNVINQNEINNISTLEQLNIIPTQNSKSFVEQPKKNIKTRRSSPLKLDTEKLSSEIIIGSKNSPKLEEEKLVDSKRRASKSSGEESTSSSRKRPTTPKIDEQQTLEPTKVSSKRRATTPKFGEQKLEERSRKRPVTPKIDEKSPDEISSIGSKRRPVTPKIGEQMLEERSKKRPVTPKIDEKSLDGITSIGSKKRPVTPKFAEQKLEERLKKRPRTPKIDEEKSSDSSIGSKKRVTSKSDEENKSSSKRRPITPKLDEKNKEKKHATQKTIEENTQNNLQQLDVNKTVSKHTTRSCSLSPNRTRNVAEIKIDSKNETVKDQKTSEKVPDSKNKTLMQKSVELDSKEFEIVPNFSKEKEIIAPNFSASKSVKSKRTDSKFENQEKFVPSIIKRKSTRMGKPSIKLQEAQNIDNKEQNLPKASIVVVPIALTEDKQNLTEQISEQKNTDSLNTVHNLIENCNKSNLFSKEQNFVPCKITENVTKDVEEQLSEFLVPKNKEQTDFVHDENISENKEQNMFDLSEFLLPKTNDNMKKTSELNEEKQNVEQNSLQNEFLKEQTEKIADDNVLEAQTEQNMSKLNENDVLDDNLLEQNPRDIISKDISLAQSQTHEENVLFENVTKSVDKTSNEIDFMYDDEDSIGAKLQKMETDCFSKTERPVYTKKSGEKVNDFSNLAEMLNEKSSKMNVSTSISKFDMPNLDVFDAVISDIDKSNTDDINITIVKNQNITKNKTKSELSNDNHENIQERNLDKTNIDVKINQNAKIDTNIHKETISEIHIDTNLVSVDTQVDSSIIDNINKINTSTQTAKRKITTEKIKKLNLKIKNRNMHIKSLNTKNKMLEYKYKMAECKNRLLTKDIIDLYSLLEDYDPNNQFLKKIKKFRK